MVVEKPSSTGDINIVFNVPYEIDLSSFEKKQIPNTTITTSKVMSKLLIEVYHHLIFYPEDAELIEGILNARYK